MKKKKRLSFNDLYVMCFVFGAYTVFSLSKYLIEDDALGWIVGIVLGYVYYLWFVWNAPDAQKADRLAQLEEESGDPSTVNHDN
jgi:hypothetical protein